jgi:hypothetical protein
MSEAKVEAGRSVEERVALAMPSFVVRLLLTGLARLPPGAHLRRRVLKRAYARGFEGINRDDYEFALLFYEPDVEIRLFGEVPRALGLPESYHGHQGGLDLWRDYKQDAGLRVTPEQIIDLGDRTALRVTAVAVGRSSGVATTHTSGHIVYWSPHGMVARHDWYWAWEDALATLERGK